MSPLAITLTFLTLIGLLTSSEISHYANRRLASHLVQEKITFDQQQTDLVQQALFEDLKDEYLKHPLAIKSSKQSTTPKKTATNPKKTPSLNYNVTRPPNNSRLNFYLVLQEEDSFYYELAAEFLRQRYASCSFYSPGIEYRLLQALIANADQTAGFEYPDELATLDLGDATLQNVWYHMLKGTESSSLLLYITFDQPVTRTQKKLNLLFASNELLEAIFLEPALSTRIKELRNYIWGKILDQQEYEYDSVLTRTKIRQELTASFDALLATSILSDELKKRFDFTLGKSGNILFIQDPKTGSITRKKLIKKSAFSLELGDQK